MVLRLAVGITILVLQVVVPAAANLSIKEFDYVPAPTSGPTRLHDGWTDRSRLSCFATCLSRFPSNCHSVMYNKDTQFCTPGDWLDPAQPIPTPAEGALYVSRQIQKQCSADDGFYEYSVNNVTGCLHVYNGPEVNYEDAKSYCASLDANVFTFRSVDEFALIGQVPLPAGADHLWIGLDDIANEFTFRWVDTGEQIDDSLKTAVFLPGEPNISANEDCVLVDLFWMMLNDVVCTHQEFFICQRQ